MNFNITKLLLSSERVEKFEEKKKAQVSIRLQRTLQNRRQFHGPFRVIAIEVIMTANMLRSVMGCDVTNVTCNRALFPQSRDIGVTCEF